MTARILDTGAVFTLLNRPRSPLWRELVNAAREPPPSGILVPAPVLAEVAQARAPGQRRLDAMYEIVDIAAMTARLALMTAEGLRAIQRHRCPECSNFVRPTLVDAAVVALAALYAEQDAAIIYTQDVRDLAMLRDAMCMGVEIRPV